MKQFFLNKRFGLGLCLLFLAVTLVFGWDRGGNDEAIAQESPDAIAIRVIPNPDHYSPMRWYREQGFSGAPQSLLVDGYEAIRDGRTVYVNAANVTGDNKIYTNIYLISYNQDAESKTVDIFGRILAQWKFNTNPDGSIDGVGVCSGNAERNCVLDSHCEAMGYCRLPGFCENNTEKQCFSNEECSDSAVCKRTKALKAELIRDVKRLSQLAEINIALENYKNRNQRYPALSAGTYLASTTVSVWPSWQNTLAKDLGVTLPIDPINRLGDCGGSGFNPITCWDENDKSFAGSINDDGKLVLPDNSFAFVYSSNYNGSEANVCAVMESGLISEYGEGACPGSNALTRETGVTGQVDNRPPRLQVSCPPVACGTINYTVQMKAIDPDGDLVTLSIEEGSLKYKNIEEEEWGLLSDWAGPTGKKWSGTPTSNWIVDDPDSRLQEVSSQANVAKIVFFRVGEVGYYSFTVKADDGRPGGVVERVCNIKVYNETFSLLPLQNATIYNYPFDGGFSQADYNKLYYPIAYTATSTIDRDLNVKYSLATPKPDWLSINQDSGVISINDVRKVRSVEEHDIKVTAREGYCGIEEEGYKITVEKNEWCGDGIMQENHGEECDKEDGLDGWSCFKSSLFCEDCERRCEDGNNPYRGICGDDEVQGHEQCDGQGGGGMSEDDQYECLNCQWDGGWCGDGERQADHGEECDLGDLNNNQGACLKNCKNASCGDGFCQIGVENNVNCPQDCPKTDCCVFPFTFPCVFCDSCFGYGQGCASLSVEQGDWQASFTPYHDDKIVTEFYCYNKTCLNPPSPYTASANFPIEYSIAESGNLIIFAYIDSSSTPEPMMNIGFVTNIADGSGASGNLNLDFRGDGWDMASIKVSDDSAAITGSSNEFTKQNGGRWTWSGHYTDGGMIEIAPLDTSWEIEITLSGSAGLDVWAVKGVNNQEIKQVIPEGPRDTTRRPIKIKYVAP